MPAEMTDRRFPPPWTLDEHDECFIVRDANGQALTYVYCEEEPGVVRRTSSLATRPGASPPTSPSRRSAAPKGRPQINPDRSRSRHPQTLRRDGMLRHFRCRKHGMSPS